MRMIVVMLVIMWVIVRIRYCGLLLGSLICVCHLSRGQNPCLPGNVCVCRAARHALRARLRLIPTVRGFGREGQTSRLPLLPPETVSSVKNKHSSLHQCSRKVPETVELNENISSRIFHCIDCPGCSTTIPVSSSFAH